MRSALKNQYHAAMKTLRLAIEKCPDDLWASATDGASAFWRVAYHTIFFADFYSLQSKDDFKPWPKHREEAVHIAQPGDAKQPKECPAYTKEEISDFWKHVDGLLDAHIDSLDLEAQQCGFPWYKMPTLEHQLVNLRHIQHHAASLATRLRLARNIRVEWVGRA